MWANLYPKRSQKVIFLLNSLKNDHKKYMFTKILNLKRYNFIITRYPPPPIRFATLKKYISDQKSQFHAVSESWGGTLTDAHGQTKQSCILKSYPLLFLQVWDKGQTNGRTILGLIQDFLSCLGCSDSIRLQPLLSLENLISFTLLKKQLT